MTAIFLCLCVLSVLTSVYAQVTSKGHCAIFDSKAKFSITQFYTGTWYVVEGYPNKYHGPEAICQEFTMDMDAKYVQINETVFNTDTSSLKQISGSARFSRKGESNHLALYPGLKSLPQGADVWVVATDYNNFALLYVCSSSSSFLSVGKSSYFAKKSSVLDKQAPKKQEYMYVLSRVPTLRPEIRAKIVVDNIVRGGFPVAPLAPMNQMDCPYVERTEQ